MTHIWIRAEERPNEQRVGVTPDGVAELLRAGFQVTLEEDPTRAISLADYKGCRLAATGSWRNAPKDAIIFGLKELPDDDSPLVHRHNIQSFMDGMAWGAQILMFVLLGLLVVPAELVPHIPTALLLTVGLILVARPLSVMLTIAPLGLLHKRFRFSWREQALLSWAGLKGAVPIILALVPLLNDVPGSTFIFNVTFVCVVVGTAVQGLSIAPLARWLGLTGAPEPEEPLRIELVGAAPPGSAVLDLRLLPDAPAVGQRLADLDIPAHMVVAVVVRNGTLIAPRGALRFQPDDHVYVIMEDAEANHLPRVFVPVASSPPSSS